MGFGTHVKEYRKKKGWTLQELSTRSQVSRSMLSQIEREEKNPTLQVACNIAEALDTTVSHLLGEQEAVNTMVVRKSERALYLDEETGHRRYVLSPTFPSKGLEFILNVLPVSGSTGRFPAHQVGVAEYITVLEGRLKVLLGSGKDQVFELEQEDSFYFEASIEHIFVNIGDIPCKYILVISGN